MPASSAPGTSGSHARSCPRRPPTTMAAPARTDARPLATSPPGLTAARHRRHRSSRGTAQQPRRLGIFGTGAREVRRGSHGCSASSSPELARYGLAATACHGGAQINTSRGGSASSALELARYGPAAMVCHGDAQIDIGGSRPPVSRPSTSLSVAPLLQEAKCASLSSQFLAIPRSKF
ncbi:hypothetical protein PVAP13_2NG330803 [Panicum virgatum]|uniref:Uncharacterized protein n=1 Tax=Panicum virgatum TaxID=38727 RepID=A0A8T0VMI4_PANVG|nr:hypothetical protein PVAP13_2NG330803 [Panicum virgatum]